MENIVTKRCTGCKELKSIGSFSPNKSKCKVCRSKENALYNKLHPKKHNAGNARYRRKFPDIFGALVKAWKDNHPARNKEYYLRNKESVKRKNLAWRRENTEKVKVYDARRRASKRNAEGSYTADEWKELCEKYGNKCLCCEQKKPLTADHVIPLAKGGSNGIGNIQPLCKTCNSSKGTKSIDYRQK